jgi:opacity protein-like surface antigen
MTTDFYDLSLSSGEKTGMPFDVSIELVYKINSNFGISIGTGYISKGLSGSQARFLFAPGGSVGGDFVFNPLFRSDLYPLYLSAVWCYPIMLEGEIFVLGGVGYYFGRISCISYDSEHNLHDPENSWNYLPWLYKSDINSLGYHGGIGLEYDVSNRSSLFIEAIYRLVNIKNLDSVNRDVEASGIFDLLGDEIKGLGAKSTFMYIQRFGGEEAWGDILYQISNLSFSGVSFRVGYKFRF